MLLRLADGSNGSVSKDLDTCIRRLSARQTEKRPDEWYLLSAQKATGTDLEVRYASTFPINDRASLTEYVTYARTSLSRDIEDTCNIRGVFVASVRRPEVASVGTNQDPVRPGGMDTRIALAATLGGIAVVAVIIGVIALVYAQWRGRAGISSLYSSEMSDGEYPPPIARGLRFSASRDDSRPSPYAPIQEIPVSDEGDTVQSATWSYDDDSIYADSSSDSGGGSAHHSIQAFTGAWGALAAREVSEPGDEIDADSYGGPGPFMAPLRSSFSDTSDAGVPAPPPPVAVPLPQAAVNAHPYDYIIGFGPVSHEAAYLGITDKERR